MIVKILNPASKVISAICIFFVPIIIVFNRYNETTVTVEVNNGIGLVPTIFITVILFVAIYWLFSQLMAMMKKQPFGWLSLMLFGAVLGVSLFGVWFVLNSVTIQAQTQLQDFIDTMTYHRQTVYYMLYPIGIGIGIACIMTVLNIKLKP